MSGETIFDKTEKVKLVYDSIEDISFLRQFPNVTELRVSWTVMNDKAQLNVINELKTLQAKHWFYLFRLDNQEKYFRKH